MQNNIKELNDKVIRWNNLMGVDVNFSFKFPDMQTRVLAHDLMVEESEELRDAETKDDVLDACADQLFVLMGNMAKYGVSYDEVIFKLRQVVKSNFSKFATSKESAEASIISEAERLNIPQEDVGYTRIDGLYVIYNKKSGKILKSVEYLPPNES